MPHSTAFDKCFFNISWEFTGSAAQGRFPRVLFAKTAHKNRKNRVSLPNKNERQVFLLRTGKYLAALLLLPLSVLLFASALTGGFPSAGAADAAVQVGTVRLETCVGASTGCTLRVENADAEIVLFQLTERPRLGSAKIENDALLYTPGEHTGTDRFAYTAVDAEGNVAEPAEIIVKITKNRVGLTYADMEGDPAHYAALCLARKGIMQGERIGDTALFRPTQTVTRSEFIAMAVSAAGLRVTPAERTDFADDSGLSAWAKPYISAAAADGIVSGYRTAGALSEIRGQNPVTLAEASVIVAGLLRGTDGVCEVMAPLHSESRWDERALSAMADAEILDADTLSQDSRTPLTRRTACEMLYRMMQALG